MFLIVKALRFELEGEIDEFRNHFISISEIISETHYNLSAFTTRIKQDGSIKNSTQA